MKSIPVLLAGAILCLAGCKYEAPLTREHSIPVDASVLGFWEVVPDGNGSPDSSEHMMVLQFSETEYLIHYSAKEEPMYFRGYPIKIGGVSCVQLQLIGIDYKPVDRQQKDLFHVAAYESVNGELIIRTLNSDLVGDGLKDTEALEKAFLKHKDSRELFANPCRFRKKLEVKGDNSALK